MEDPQRPCFMHAVSKVENFSLEYVVKNVIYFLQIS